MPDTPTELADENLRMRAYHYGFDCTGVREVDLVLSAVACAGKAFHHTEEWREETPPWPGHTGESPVEWIQNAAVKAATRLRELEAENKRLRRQHAAEILALLPGGAICDPQKIADAIRDWCGDRDLEAIHA